MSAAAKTIAHLDPREVRRYHELGWWRTETIVDDFLTNVCQYPDKTAVVSVYDGRVPETLTYRELGDRVDRLAAGLIRLGVEPGDVVSFQLPNRWEFTALNLACGRIGAVANPVLPILRRREVAFIGNQVGSKVFVTSHIFRGFDYAAMLSDVKSEVPSLERVFVVGSEGDLPDGTERFETLFEHTPDRTTLADELDARRPSGDCIAQIQFTSGTTGTPKGVVHTHNTLYAGANAARVALQLGRDDNILAFTPLSHALGFLFGCTYPMMCGATVVYQDVWDPRRAVELIAGHHITWTMGTTAFLDDLCRVAADSPVEIATLKSVTCAGAPIPPSLVDRVHRLLGARVLSGWGMTECGLVTSTHRDDDADRSATTDGRCMPWNQVRVVGDDDRDLGFGEVGRLLVRGASLFIGYHGREDLFASSTRDGWLDTGDLARMEPDGSIRITGRTKDLVIRGGENIPVVEVEAALITHPAVQEAFIIGVPDDRLGERACAVVVPVDPVSPPSLRTLTEHLEQLGMAKTFWPEFVVHRSSLPRTPSGKIQKYRLRQDLDASSTSERDSAGR